MGARPQAVFLLNLVQDVSIARPLIFMASRDLSLPVLLLVSDAFQKRDRLGLWAEEISEMAKATNAAVLVYETPARALHFLSGGRGIIIAASDSNLPAHIQTHDVLRLAGPDYRTITLQHGLECVGFLQSRDHDLAHGRNVAFGAQTVCGWMETPNLHSMLPAERSKLVVTGPTAILQQSRGNKLLPTRSRTGIVCENLHSARFRMAGDFKGDFLEVFNAFCGELEQNDEKLVLRPHPGGQYVLRNATTLPPNVRLNNHPIYKVDLRCYAYGISAPSSILVDMVLAGIPTAVWRDSASLIDASNYDGLAVVRDVQDWLAFSRQAQAEPNGFREAQAKYIERLKIPTDPYNVAQRFLRLMRGAIEAEAITINRDVKEVERVLFVANSRLATLQISFERPLSPVVAEGRIETLLVDETELAAKFPEGKNVEAQRQNWVRRQLDTFDPTLVVFCRYSGVHSDLILQWAHERRVSTMMHIDDDLLGVPETHGESKFRYHNDPRRLKTVRELLSTTNLIYCSTPNLKRRLIERGIINKIVVGKIYCPGVIIRHASPEFSHVIGYTGMSEKVRELNMVVPALEHLMAIHPKLRLELMGGLPLPASLARFNDRVLLRPPVADYASFLSKLASFEWDIGICPLEATPFNVVKANTKWVEYTSTGIAVVASSDTVYDECCAEGCGILAKDGEGWLQALEYLISNPEQRFEQVLRAQAKLKAAYSPERLTQQVLGILEHAKVINEGSLSAA